MVERQHTIAHRVVSLVGFCRVCAVLALRLLYFAFLSGLLSCGVGDGGSIPSKAELPLFLAFFGPMWR